MVHAQQATGGSKTVGGNPVLRIAPVRARMQRPSGIEPPRCRDLERRNLQLCPGPARLVATRDGRLHLRAASGICSGPPVDSAYPTRTASKNLQARSAETGHWQAHQQPKHQLQVMFGSLVWWVLTAWIQSAHLRPARRAVAAAFATGGH